MCERLAACCVLRLQSAARGQPELEARPHVVDADVTVLRGETLTTTCSYLHRGMFPTGFGVSFSMEQCYVSALFVPGPDPEPASPTVLGVQNACMRPRVF